MTLHSLILDTALATVGSSPDELRTRALRVIYVMAVENPRERWIVEMWAKSSLREHEVRRLVAKGEAYLAACEEGLRRRIVPISIPHDLENAALEDGVQREQQAWNDHLKLVRLFTQESASEPSTGSS